MFTNKYKEKSREKKFHGQLIMNIKIGKWSENEKKPCSKQFEQGFNRVFNKAYSIVSFLTTVFSPTVTESKYIPSGWFET